MDSDESDITRLLDDWQNGSQDAFQQLVPLVYEELRTIASRHLSREWRQGHLQTTAVVNEAYLRLFGQRQVDWQNRGHFFAIAAELMRRILVDDARRERRQKRGGGAIPSSLDDVDIVAPAANVIDTLDLDRALRNLEQLDPHAAKLVELRFFGGLTIEETAGALGISAATVKRDWAIAKGWLHRELSAGRSADEP